MGIQIEQNTDAGGASSYTMQFRFDPDEAEGIEFTITGTTITMRPVGASADMDLAIEAKGAGEVTIDGLVTDGGGGSWSRSFAIMGV